MKDLTLALLLLFSSSIAFGDDLTEWGELVSIEVYSSLSDDAALHPGGRATLRVNGMDTVYTFSGGVCDSRSYNSSDSILQNALLAPYMRVRFRTEPGSLGAICVIGFELTNEKFLVP